jgi:hypothetical protein
MFEQWPFLVIWLDKLNRRVVVGQIVMTCIDELSIVLRHYSEVFVAFVNTHHVLHAISMWLGERTVAVPVSDNANV